MVKSLLMIAGKVFEEFGRLSFKTADSMLLNQFGEQALSPRESELVDYHDYRRVGEVESMQTLELGGGTGRKASRNT